MRHRRLHLITAIAMGAILFAAIGTTLPRAASAATAERRVCAVANDAEIGITKPTDAVPQGMTGTSAVCNKAAWTVISDAIDISDWDKDKICLEMWMHVSDAAALNGAPYDINNMGIALINDGNNWVNYRYISWFPTMAEIGTWTDGWNKISIHFAREAQQKPDIQFAMDFSAVKLCMQAYIFDDLYLHDTYLVERAQSALSVVTDKQPIEFDAKSMSLNAQSLKLETGENFFLNATVRPRSAAERVTVGYTSSDPSIASVDGAGKIIAKSSGKCTITARVPVTQGPDIVSKVSVNVLDRLPVNSGNRIVIDPVTADRRGSAGGDGVYNDVLWPGAAGIWRVSPLNDGSSTVFANFEKHSAAGIGRVNLSSFTLKNTVLKFNLFVPDSDDLTVGDMTNSCAFGISDSLAYATWSTNNYLRAIDDDFADRLENGWNTVSIKLSSMAVGGTLNKADASFLFCQPPKAGRLLGFNGVTLYETEQTEDLIVTPAGGYKAMTQLSAPASIGVAADASVRLDVTTEPADATCKSFLTYRSSDETVARVDAGGNVWGVGEGTATVTVSAIGYQENAAVEVRVSAPVTTSGLKLDISKKRVSVGERFVLKATATGTDTPTVVWQTDDSTVAIVDASGSVTVVGEGKTVIRAMTTDGRERVECAIETTGAVKARNNTILAAVLGSAGGLIVAGGVVFVLYRKKRSSKKDGENN